MLPSSSGDCGFFAIAESGMASTSANTSSDPYMGMSQNKGPPLCLHQYILAYKAANKGDLASVTAQDLLEQAQT